MTQRDIKPIIKKVKETLKEIYGERLKGVILYGSHARGDAKEGSDIDLIILLGKAETPVIERNRFFDRILELDLKCDTVISITPFDEEFYRERNLPLILNARREGVYV